MNYFEIAAQNAAVQIQKKVNLVLNRMGITNLGPEEVQAAARADIARTILVEFECSVPELGGDLQLKTEDHPEANGGQAAPGAAEYQLNFPLEGGRKLRLRLGESGFQEHSQIVMDALTNAPSYDHSCPSDKRLAEVVKRLEQHKAVTIDWDRASELWSVMLGSQAQIGSVQANLWTAIDQALIAGQLLAEVQPKSGDRPQPDLQTAVCRMLEVARAMEIQGNGPLADVVRKVVAAAEELRQLRMKADIVVNGVQQALDEAQTEAKADLPMSNASVRLETIRQLSLPIFAHLATTS